MGIEAVLAENLKRLREDRSLTQAQLAEMSGLSVTAVAHFETGRRWPKPESIKAIADAFRVKQEDLFKSPSQLAIENPSPLEALEVIRRALLGATLPKVDHLPPHLLETIAGLKNLELITDALDFQAPGWRDGRPQERAFDPTKVRSKANS